MKLKKLLLFSLLIIGQIESSVYTFNNTTSITIRDNDTAIPYPSSIIVSGIPTNEIITKVTVTLNKFSHEFPSDVQVLLSGPNNSNFVLMSGAGTLSVNDINITFDDTALKILPQANAISSDTYKPTVYFVETSFPNIDPNYVIPLYTIEDSIPLFSQNTLANTYNGINPNGNWNLFVLDAAPPSSGSITAGWTLQITTEILPVPSCSISGRQSALFAAIRSKFGL